MKINNDSLILEPLDNKLNTKIFYESEIYFCNQSIFNTKLISKSIIFLKYICIFNSNNKSDYHKNIILKINGNLYNISNNLNGIYTLNIPFKFEKDIFYDFRIEGLENDVNIKIIGNYNYEAGSYWHNIINSHKYVNRKVLVNNDLNNSYELFVNGDGYIENNLESTKIETNRLLNKGVFKINGYLYTNFLQSSKNLNLDCDNIYINSKSTQNDLCIIGSSKISSTGILETNNLFVENNLKTSQINKLNSFNRIEFDNDTTKIISKFYPTNMIDSNSISGVPTLDKTIFCIKDNDVYFNSKTIITKKSELNNLNKNYDLYIDNFDVKCESINYDNLICNSIDFDITSKITNIKSVKTSTLLTPFANLGSYGNIKTIYSKIFNLII